MGLENLIDEKGEVVLHITDEIRKAAKAVVIQRDKLENSTLSRDEITAKRTYDGLVSQLWETVYIANPNIDPVVIHANNPLKSNQIYVVQMERAVGKRLNDLLADIAKELGIRSAPKIFDQTLTRG